MKPISQRDGLAVVFEKLVALEPEAAYIVDPKIPDASSVHLEVATLTRETRSPLSVAKALRTMTSLEIGIDVCTGNFTRTD